HRPRRAKMAASRQAFSRGRLVLGYGAGWLEREYRAYGYEFPSTRTRIEQMVEALELMRLMWTSSPASYAGTHYRVENAYCEPRPAPLPLVVVDAAGGRRAWVGLA